MSVESPAVTRTCTRCGVAKSLDDFHRQKGGKHGLRSDCKVCQREAHARWCAANPEKVQAQQRRYYERNRESRKAASTAYAKRHRERISERNKAARAANPEHYERYEFRRSLTRLYGINLEDYERLLTEQNGVCAICRQTCSSRKRLAVDHCHASGKVRGLLCQTCNLALGQFKDSRELLTAAVAYLDERW